MHCFFAGANKLELLRAVHQSTSFEGLMEPIGSKMLRWLAIAMSFAGAQVALCADDVQAQPIDEWHYIDADSVLHIQRVDGLHGAGVIQSDKLFAMLYLGVPDENGVVSVVLPTENAAIELTSTLIATNGQRFDRVLTAEEMDIAAVSPGTYAYSFPINALDVDRFKSARSWQIQVAERKWIVTLTGSRRAITEAERQFALMLERLEADAGVPAISPAAD